MRGTLTSAPAPRHAATKPVQAARSGSRISRAGALKPEVGPDLHHCAADGHASPASSWSSSHSYRCQQQTRRETAASTTTELQDLGRSSVCGAVGRHAACPRVAAIQTREGAKRRRGARKSPDPSRAGVTRAGSPLDRARVLAQYASGCHARNAAPDYARLDTRPVRIDKRPAGASGQRRPRRVRGDHHRHDKKHTKKSHDHPRDPV